MTRWVGYLLRRYLAHALGDTSAYGHLAVAVINACIAELQP